MWNLPVKTTYQIRDGQIVKVKEEVITIDRNENDEIIVVEELHEIQY